MDSIPRHSWESLPEHTWEESDDEQHGFDASDTERPPTSAEATEEFLVLLVNMLMGSTPMASNHFCLLCYYASLAGMPGIKEWGMGPGRDSGHYSRHLKVKLGSTGFQKQLYELEIPGNSNLQLARTPLRVLASPGHEL
eukprot:15441537-Alexandrium_andersonii.AAC.1